MFIRSIFFHIIINIMSKSFDIKKIYPDVQFTKSKVLSIESISQMYENEKFEPTENLPEIKLAEKLKENYDMRQKTKQGLYNTIYIKCANDILLADKTGGTQIEFTLPSQLTDYPLYKKDECLVFIVSKLKEQSIDCEITNAGNIVISWSNLETKSYT